MPLYPGHLVADRAAELEQETGLPEAGLARQEDDLAVAASRLREVLLEKRELPLAANEWRQAALGRCFERVRIDFSRSALKAGTGSPFPLSSSAPRSSNSK